MIRDYENSSAKYAKTIRREKARNANHIHYEKLNSFENVLIEKLLEKMPLPPKTFFSKIYTIDDHLMERTFRLSQKSPLKLNDKNVSSNTDKIIVQSFITKDVSINNFQQEVTNPTKEYHEIAKETIEVSVKGAQTEYYAFNNLLQMIVLAIFENEKEFINQVYNSIDGLISDGVYTAQKLGRLLKRKD